MTCKNIIKLYSTMLRLKEEKEHYWQKYFKAMFLDKIVDQPQRLKHAIVLENKIYDERETLNIFYVVGNLKIPSPTPYFNHLYWQSGSDTLGFGGVFEFSLPLKKEQQILHPPSLG